MLQDYEITLESALQGLSSKSAVQILNYANQHSDLHLETFITLQLSYVRLLSLSVEQLTALMTKSILAAYRLPGYSLAEKVMIYNQLLFDAGQEVVVCRNVKNILQKNQEQLGTSNLNSNNKSLPSVVANWIQDYNLDNQHDPLSQLRYIDSSPNVKQLDESQRAILLDIFKLYDKSAGIVDMWDNLEVPTEEELAKQEFRITDYYPDLEPADPSEPDYQVEDSNLTTEPLKPIIANKSEVAKTNELIVSVSKASADQFVIKKNIGSIKQEKRGLVFDVPTNIDLKEVEQKAREQEQKQKDIANKLEDLKKRQQQNK